MSQNNLKDSELLEQIYEHATRNAQTDPEFLENMPEEQKEIFFKNMLRYAIFGARIYEYIKEDYAPYLVSREGPDLKTELLKAEEALDRTGFLDDATVFTRIADSWPELEEPYCAADVELAKKLLEKGEG